MPCIPLDLLIGGQVHEAAYEHNLSGDERGRARAKPGTDATGAGCASRLGGRSAVLERVELVGGPSWNLWFQSLLRARLRPIRRYLRSRCC